MVAEAEIKKDEGGGLKKEEVGGLKKEEGEEGGGVKKESENRLYVGKLNVITNEDKLKKYFEDYGEVEDCFIMRFPDTRKSKCFGFITFKREEDLVDALAGDHVLDENKLELRKAVPRGESDAEVFKKERAKYVGSKMYVGNLTEETTAEDLEKYFSSIGKVVDSFIMKDSFTGKSKKFGFVTFEDVPTMEKCLEKKPHSINETEVEIKRAAPKKDPYGNMFGKRKFEEDDDDIIEGEHVELRRLYVGSLPLTASEDDVKQYFEKFGKVIECILQKNRTTNKSKGMAFITFAEASTVNEIQSSLPHKMENKTLDSRRPAPKGVHPKDPEMLAVTKKLWVGGVNDVISDDDIKEYFEQYGKVEGVEVPLDSEEKKRGFGFVTFDSSDTVDKLILMGHHKIKGRRMDVKKGLDKKEMAAVKRQREHEFMQTQFRFSGGPGPRDMGMGMRGGGGFGRGAKSMRTAGGGGAGFGRGGASSGRGGVGIGPDGKKKEILSKIDAIYDNIAQLNQLTNDPSMTTDMMGMGFGGGGMGGGRGGGFGGVKGNYGHTYGGGDDRMGGFSSDSFDEGFGGGYSSGGGFGNGGGGYGGGGYGSGGGGYGSGGGYGGGGYGSGGGGYGNGGGYGSGGGYGAGGGFGNGRGFGNGGSMGGFKSGGMRGGGSSYGNKRGGNRGKYGGAPNYEDY